MSSDNGAAAATRRGTTLGATCLVLTATLLACCPAPGGVLAETSFTAHLTSFAGSTGEALLESGRPVLLSFARPPRERLAAGQRVYVEGLASNQAVQVTRILVLSTVSPAR
jgi:hypothetical protein